VATARKLRYQAEFMVPLFDRRDGKRFIRHRRCGLPLSDNEFASGEFCTPPTRGRFSLSGWVFVLSSLCHSKWVGLSLICAILLSWGIPLPRALRLAGRVTFTYARSVAYSGRNNLTRMGAQLANEMRSIVSQTHQVLDALECFPPGHGVFPICTLQLLAAYLSIVVRNPWRLR